MKLKKKEDQRVGALVLLRKGNKILMGANTETKCGAEPEGKTAPPGNPSYIQSPNPYTRTSSLPCSFSPFSNSSIGNP